jgi:hypothetical protein
LFVLTLASRAKKFNRLDGFVNGFGLLEFADTLTKLLAKNHFDESATKGATYRILALTDCFEEAS